MGREYLRSEKVNLLSSLTLSPSIEFDEEEEKKMKIQEEEKSFLESEKRERKNLFTVPKRRSKREKLEKFFFSGNWGRRGNEHGCDAAPLQCPELRNNENISPQCQ